MSCAKDGSTVCWDVPTGEVIGELPGTGDWNLDVQVPSCWMSLSWCTTPSVDVSLRQKVVKPADLFQDSEISQIFVLIPLIMWKDACCVGENIY